MEWHTHTHTRARGWKVWTNEPFVMVLYNTTSGTRQEECGEAFRYYDADRLAALTLAIKLNAGLTFSCCVRLSYVDFCMAVE